MATITRELDQVCEPCRLLIANGEAWENHEDVSERTVERQAAHMGADAAYLVLDLPEDDEPADHEAIGPCQACGHEPATGYWMAHRAFVIR